MNQRRSFLRNAIQASVLCFISPALLSKESDANNVLMGNSQIEHSNTLDLRSSASSNGYLCISGLVYDKTGLNTQAAARIEILDPVTGESYVDRKSTLVTNENGEYQFLIDMPVRIQAKAPTIKFSVSGKEDTYTSELIVTDFDAFISDKHWEKNRKLGDKLFPVKEDFKSHSQITLNISA